MNFAKIFIVLLSWNTLAQRLWVLICWIKYLRPLLPNLLNTSHFHFLKSSEVYNWIATIFYSSVIYRLKILWSCKYLLEFFGGTIEKRVEEWTEKLVKLYFRTISGCAVFKRIKTIRNCNFSVNYYDKDLFHTHIQCFKVCHKGLLWVFIAYLKVQWILNFDSLFYWNVGSTI